MEQVSVCRRGWFEEDIRSFGDKKLMILKNAAEDIIWLLNRGYALRSAISFAGNHYSLTDRQRLALFRAVASDTQIENRKKKLLSENQTFDSPVIDGFNTIVTLETALSASLLLKCRDKTIRDLAGLRGTYRIIDKTEKAISLIIETLKISGIKKCLFYLDKQVSNSGRLKTLIAETAEFFSFPAEIELASNVDTKLIQHPCVITSDSVVLDKCISWKNLCGEIIEKYIPQAWLVNILP